MKVFNMEKFTGISWMCVITWWHGGKEDKGDWEVPSKRSRRNIEMQEIPFKYQDRGKNTAWGWLGTGPHCLGILLSLSYLNLFQQGVGLGYLWRHLWTSAILWFYLLIHITTALLKGRHCVNWKKNFESECKDMWKERVFPPSLLHLVKDRFNVKGEEKKRETSKPNKDTNRTNKW